MKIKLGFAIILGFVTVASCDDTDNKTNIACIDCNRFKAVLLAYNDDATKQEIIKIANNLTPHPTDSDQIGHLGNFQRIIDTINSCAGIDAELICYACIESYPPQSELLITIDSAGHSVQRIIDILTPDDSTLSFNGVHAYFGISQLEYNGLARFGCYNEQMGYALKNGLAITDTVFYLIENDTLTLHVIKNYNCCGLLNDSIVINNGNVDIYMADTCIESCLCRCMCDFETDYKFTGFWQKNTHFNVYLKGYQETSYILWKSVAFIDGLD